MTDRERELEALLERCYAFLVGYNPETMEGPPEPNSRTWLVVRCVAVIQERNDRMFKENAALRAELESFRADAESHQYGLGR